MNSHALTLFAVTAALITAAACGGTTTTTSGSPAAADAAAPGAEEAGTACDGAACDGTDLSFNTPTVCTSATQWTRGDRGSFSMHPGVACIACHDANRGPSFSIGGTVYPSAHEPDDCNGIKGPAQVVITDAMGKVTTLAVNAAGTFYSAADIALPFRAKVVAGGKERVMVTPQKDGDCNSCHTEKGSNAAPGRIVSP